jgi:integrase
MFGRKANIRSDKTAKHYRYSINSFGKHLGRLPTEADLDDDSLIAWMGELQRGPGSTTTGRTYLERIRALWRFLNDRGEIGTRPSFSLPPIPEPTPLALDESQLRRLFESAVCRPGLVCGVPARYWWPALFGFVFCTSERRGATLALQWQWVDLNSRAVSFPAAVRKGGLKAATYRLWPEVVDLLERIAGSNRELVFPWEKSEATFYHHYGKILVDAQIPDDRRHKLQGLRVTHNTWTKVMTGRHSPLLMHSSSATSERHYEDKRYTVREAVKLLIPWRSPAMAEAESAPVVALNINDREVRKLPRARVLSGKAVS